MFLTNICFGTNILGVSVHGFSKYIHTCPPRGLGAGSTQVSKTCKLLALGSDRYGLGSNLGQLCPKGCALSTSLPCLPPGWAREGRTQETDFVRRAQPKYKSFSTKKREGKRKPGSDLDPESRVQTTPFQGKCFVIPSSGRESRGEQ